MPKTEPQEGRVRSLWIDFPPNAKFPVRGDRVSSGKSTYYVLHGVAMKRRNGVFLRQRENGDEFIRWKMAVIKLDDLPKGLNARLIRSAIRNHGSSLLFSFTWYPRKKKTQTFEQYMRRQK